MFVLQPKPTFEADAVIPIPGEKEGKITFIFNHKGRKALREFYDSLDKDEKLRTDVDALGELVAGWKGVDEKYSPAALETLLDSYPGAASNIFEAYNKGLVEGKQKN